MIRHLFKTESLARPLLACLAAAFVTVFTYNVADPDLWGHVRYGADMLQQGHVFTTDPYSYLSDGFPWINHELLCEFTLGFLEPRFGPIGLLLWKCLMGAATLGALIWSHRRSEFRPVTVVLIGVLLALSLWPGWTVRPQIFTYTFLSLLALGITEHDRGSSWALWVVPPLMVAWTNAHGGFVAGLGIFAVHVGFSLWWQVRRPESGWMSRSIELCVVFVCSCLATLVNPYGVGLLSWVWDSLTWPRPEISEWWPVPLWNSEYLPFKLLVVLSFIALAVSRRSRRWDQIAILVLAALQALLHRRHIPLFAILAAYWVAEPLDDCVRRLRGSIVRHTTLVPPDAGSVRMHRFALISLTLMFVAISIFQMQSLRVEKATFPVSAFHFIERRGLHGRMVTEFNWGQYCLYVFSPRILISVDGRFDTSYPREILDVNLDFMMGDIPRWRNRSLATGPFQADRALDLGNPNLALVDRQRSDCVRAIEQRNDWILLYQDALAQVWGLRSMYDDPGSPDYIPDAFRSISDETQTGWAAYPALPQSATE